MRKSTTESPTQLNTYEVLGDNLRIHFEEEAVNIEATEDFDASVSYKYVTAYTTKLASRAEIVEAVMRCFYPSYGAEIADIQNGGSDKDTHQARRIQAKELADGWVQVT